MESKTASINTLKAHLALNVRNVQISTEFYQKMLGAARRTKTAV